MEIPFSRWYDAIWSRRSRRLFDGQSINPAVLENLQVACKAFRPFTGVRAVLVNHSADEVFKGIVSHYGKIKGAPAFIAFIGNMEDQHIQEKLGYTGEGVVLEATALGLGTCWVGVSFRQDVASYHARIKKNEKILALTPVGYTRETWSMEEKIMTGFGRAHRRKSLEKLIRGSKNVPKPFWIQTALEAARVAPSAVNRQPWRFTVESDSITVTVNNLQDTLNISKRLDCGIAMLHIEIGARRSGVQGAWEFLDSPHVARYNWLREHERGNI
jgi:nitroreductase